jgi:hypothetical protein
VVGATSSVSLRFYYRLAPRRYRNLGLEMGSNGCIKEKNPFSKKKLMKSYMIDVRETEERIAKITNVDIPCYVYVFTCSTTGIVGSNPTQGMDVCVYSVFVLASGLAMG